MLLETDDDMFADDPYYLKGSQQQTNRPKNKLSCPSCGNPTYTKNASGKQVCANCGLGKDKT